MGSKLIAALERLLSELEAGPSTSLTTGRLIGQVRWPDEWRGKQNGNQRYSGAVGQAEPQSRCDLWANLAGEASSDVETEASACRNQRMAVETWCWKLCSLGRCPSWTVSTGERRACCECALTGLISVAVGTLARLALRTRRLRIRVLPKVMGIEEAT